MQDNSELNFKQSVFSKKIIFGLKCVFVLMLSFISYQTFKQQSQSWTLIFGEFEKAITPKNLVRLCVVLCLIGVNWACEAKKWQALVLSFTSISFTDAFKAVLVGLSFGFITPANVGDFAGRIILLGNQNQKRGIGSNLLGNGIQFYITLLFGIFAYLIFFGTNFPIFHQIIFGLLVFCVILGIIIYLQKNKIVVYLDNHKWFLDYKIYWDTFLNFKDSTFNSVFWWSFLRFLIISMQFVFVLQCFNINLSFNQLWSVSCLILLFKTIIPQVNFLTDLGIRELSALHFFNALSVNSSAVISAIFFIWIINILFPVMIGGILFLKVKTR